MKICTQAIQNKDDLVRAADSALAHWAIELVQGIIDARGDDRVHVFETRTNTLEARTIVVRLRSGQVRFQFRVVPVPKESRSAFQLLIDNVLWVEMRLPADFHLPPLEEIDPLSLAETARDTEL